MTLRLNGSTSGYTEIDAPAVGGNNTFQLPAGAPTVNNSALVCGTNGAMAFADGPLAGTRNRIINGDMRIDQRNAGASVANSGDYNLDRWTDPYVGSGRYSAQRVTTAPTGFTNSLLHTVTTAVTPAASDYYQLYQPIEGSNTADFGFGTATASTITLSFWVRSSITGTYGVALLNSAGNRCYVATYQINVANTFEYKTITITGDTSGTWLTNTGIGVYVLFDLGSGSSAETTAGSWQSGNFRRTSSCVKLISTSSATFYITGVQLEAGSVATPFERRSYGQELALCQRYLIRLNDTTDPYTMFGSFTATNSTQAYGAIQGFNFRATPTVTFSNLALAAGAAYTVTLLSAYGGRMNGVQGLMIGVASGMAAGASYMLQQNGTTAGFLQLSAEL